jgi:tetratricopeptide (TPR) repeat protein
MGTATKYTASGALARQVFEAHPSEINQDLLVEPQRASQVAHQSAGALNDASWAAVRQPGADAAAYQRALRQAEAACGLAPDVADYLNTLGVAYYRVAKYPEAVAALEKCLHANASNGVDGHVPLPAGQRHQGPAMF